MYIINVQKVGISSVVYSKHIDSHNIDVVDNDIALFDTESVISLYNGPTKLDVYKRQDSRSDSRLSGERK